VGIGASHSSSAADPLRLSVLDFVARPVIG
jgi:hypothetical protein